jgi:hypothetical protein
MHAMKLSLFLRQSKIENRKSKITPQPTSALIATRLSRP